jgi:hypothetical protein
MEASNSVNERAGIRRSWQRTSALAVALMMSCVCRSGFAQDLEGEPELSEDEAPAEADPDPDPDPDAPVEAEPAAIDDAAPEAPTPVVQSDTSSAAAESPRATSGAPDPEQKNGFVKPANDSVLSWGGSLETDTGYATYTFDSSALHDEEVYDLRGRFVLGPTVEHRFWDDWFFRARGEAVLWVREQFGVYQVNVDDAFAQVGKDNVWDFKLGRFRTWRVYHKGLGFDLFTLEDAGACVQNPCSADAGTFGPHTYEVSFIYDRETPGHAAFHVYPTAWSGIELAATYGQAGVSNHIGVRAAAMVHFDFLRVMGAAELRTARPREEASSTDGMGNTTECDKCGVSQRTGYGGGIELTLPPFEAGFSAALGATDIYTVTTGAFDEGGSNDTRSFGGYAELDVGALLFDRGLIVGFGLNRTEALAINENFREHMQYAAYVAYPLGFNGALVKLVLSRSDLTNLTLVDEMNRVFNESTSAMSAARLRFAYPF